MNAELLAIVVTCSGYGEEDYYNLYVNNELAAIASTKWIMVNSETHSVMSVTEEITNAYGPVKESVFDIPVPKLQIPDHFDSCYEYQTS